MSHFTNLKTRFQNLAYLEKALNRLNIPHKQQKQIIKNSTSKLYNVNLLIPQFNGYEIEFYWNGQEYELIIDINLLEQAYSTKNFINKIAQQYAGEVIISESRKIGFQPIKYQQNVDGSNTLILARWTTQKDIANTYCWEGN